MVRRIHSISRLTFLHFVDAPSIRQYYIQLSELGDCTLHSSFHFGSLDDVGDKSCCGSLGYLLQDDIANFVESALLTSDEDDGGSSFGIEQSDLLTNASRRAGDKDYFVFVGLIFEVRGGVDSGVDARGPRISTRIKSTR